MDTPTFIQLSDLPERELLPGFHARLIHGVGFTMAHFRIEAGGVLPQHQHPHEQLTTVLEGQLSITVAGKTQVLGPGECVLIPGNIVHSGHALTDCRAVDVFQPVREDYR